MHKLFPIHVRTLTGLEEILERELLALGAKEVQKKNRLVTCVGDLKLLYRINIFSRVAIRALKPIAAFPAPDEETLYKKIREISWGQWLPPSGTLAIDANVHSSFSTHSLFIAQLTKDAIVDQFREKFGRRPSVDLERPDLRISVSLFRNQAEISIDSSGESLHKRGYRSRAGEAPLSETLASGIIQLAGWDQKAPLFDAMTGSGTLLIEAGLLQKNIAPGLLRSDFGFKQWPNYDRTLYEEIISEARKNIRTVEASLLLGIERDPETIEIARANIERAGLRDLIQIKQGDFFEWEPLPSTRGILVMNPPYDERLPVDNIADLYQRIGDRLKRVYGGWTAFILSGNLEAAKYFGLRTSQRIPLYNGSIECRLLKYELRDKTSEVSAPKWRNETLENNPQWLEKARIFENRLKKTYKHDSKWAEREGITCWRVYDQDIPEFPFILDLYEGRLHFAEVERNHDRTPIEHKAYMSLMQKTAAQSLGVPFEKTYFKKRKPQKSGGFQYTPHAETKEFIEVKEGGHGFLVNLSDYIDVGLFLDHRKTRSLVEKQAQGKEFLNLFSYTGSFTVYAAAGGAVSSTTVDTSHTYLEWAEKNLRLNGLLTYKHTFVRSDVFEFLKRTKKTFDLCMVDPPTRSVNRSDARVFDVQTDHVRLLHGVFSRMRPQGKVFFSTNYRSFQLDETNLKKGRNLLIREITSQTVPPDFDRRPSHRCWEIDLI